jgi:hypothetical protein
MLAKKQNKQVAERKQKNKLSKKFNMSFRRACQTKSNCNGRGKGFCFTLGETKELETTKDQTNKKEVVLVAYLFVSSQQPMATFFVFSFWSKLFFCFLFSFALRFSC